MAAYTMAMHSDKVCISSVALMSPVGGSAVTCTCPLCVLQVGKLPVLSVAFVAHGTVFVYFYLYWHSNDELDPLHTDKLQHDWYVFCAVAVFLGVGDAGFNTQLYTLYESLLGKETEVFANLKFWQSVCSVVCSLRFALCLLCCAYDGCI